MSTTKTANGFKKHLGRMVISAMFLAIAVVVNLFSELSIPLFGADGMQVKFGGLFTAFPAFLFGPIYGGVVCALSDIIGTFIKPMGAYVPWFTLTAFLAGFLKGLIFKAIKDRNVKWLKAALIVLVAVSAFLGIFSYFSIKNDGLYEGNFATSENTASPQEILDNKESYSLPSKLAVKYAFSNAQRESLPAIKENETPEEYAVRLEKYETLNDNGREIYILRSKFAPALASTINIIAPILITFSVLGLVLLIFMTLAEKKYGLGGLAPKIFLSVLVAEMVQTSINSALLINLYTGTYGNFSYGLFNTPRVLEGILMSMILSYFIYILYQVYDSKIKGKLTII